MSPVFLAAPGQYHAARVIQSSPTKATSLIFHRQRLQIPLLLTFASAQLIVGCDHQDETASTFTYSDHPVAVCDLSDGSANSGVIAVLKRNQVSYSSEKFDEQSENGIFLFYVAESEMEAAAKLIATDAEKAGYKVTVHFGGNTPSRWINHN